MSTKFSNVINLCIRNNIVLTRWKKAHAMLFPKKANDNRIHRFRNINIYELDYNLYLKGLVSERTMKNSETISLPNEKWGGIKVRSSADLLLENLLTIEHSIMTNRSLGMADMDATAYYDLIIRPIGIMTLANFYLYPKASIRMLKTF